jgi:hypothetical protein
MRTAHVFKAEVKMFSVCNGVPLEMLSLLVLTWGAKWLCGLARCLVEAQSLRGRAVVGVVWTGPCPSKLRPLVTWKVLQKHPYNNFIAVEWLKGALLKIYFQLKNYSVLTFKRGRKLFSIKSTALRWDFHLALITQSTSAREKSHV